MSSAAAPTVTLPLDRDRPMLAGHRVCIWRAGGVAMVRARGAGVPNSDGKATLSFDCLRASPVSIAGTGCADGAGRARRSPSSAAGAGTPTGSGLTRGVACSIWHLTATVALGPSRVTLAAIKSEEIAATASGAAVGVLPIAASAARRAVKAAGLAARLAAVSVQAAVVTWAAVRMAASCWIACLTAAPNSRSSRLGLALLDWANSATAAADTSLCSIAKSRHREATMQRTSSASMAWTCTTRQADCARSAAPSASGRSDSTRTMPAGTPLARSGAADAST